MWSQSCTLESPEFHTIDLKNLAHEDARGDIGITIRGHHFGSPGKNLVSGHPNDIPEKIHHQTVLPHDTEHARLQQWLMAKGHHGLMFNDEYNDGDGHHHDDGCSLKWCLFTALHPYNMYQNIKHFL